MELYEKKVCLTCEYDYLEISFPTALSLFFQWFKTDIVLFECFKDLKTYLDLINHFIELGNNEDNKITISTSSISANISTSMTTSRGK